MLRKVVFLLIFSFFVLIFYAGTVTAPYSCTGCSSEETKEEAESLGIGGTQTDSSETSTKEGSTDITVTTTSSLSCTGGGTCSTSTSTTTTQSSTQGTVTTSPSGTTAINAKGNQVEGAIGLNSNGEFVFGTQADADAYAESLGLENPTITADETVTGEEGFSINEGLIGGKTIERDIGFSCDPIGSTVECTIGGCPGTQTCLSTGWSACIDNSDSCIPSGSGCNFNNRCELLDQSYGGNATENQNLCSSDCWTTISMNPILGVVPGQEVTLTIQFNDSRYIAGGKANYYLTIDGVVWDATNGCNIANVNVTPVADGVNTACTWQGVTADCTSTSVNGYLKVTTKCKVPSTLVGTTHTLTALPTIYSRATQLTAAITTFTIQTVAGSITGNVVAGGTTLRGAITQFTTAQTTGMSQIVQDFFNWILSLFG